MHFVLFFFSGSFFPSIAWRRRAVAPIHDEEEASTYLVDACLSSRCPHRTASHLMAVESRLLVYNYSTALPSTSTRQQVHTTTTHQLEEDDPTTVHALDESQRPECKTGCNGFAVTHS